MGTISLMATQEVGPGLQAFLEQAPRFANRHSDVFSSDVLHAGGLHSANIHQHLPYHHAAKLFYSVAPFMSHQLHI